MHTPDGYELRNAHEAEIDGSAQQPAYRADPNSAHAHCCTCLQPLMALNCRSGTSAVMSACGGGADLEPICTSSLIISLVTVPCKGR
jgi:hypothetical protein